jgi:hypothetical protein
MRTSIASNFGFCYFVGIITVELSNRSAHGAMRAFRWRSLDMRHHQFRYAWQCPSITLRAPSGGSDLKHRPVTQSTLRSDLRFSHKNPLLTLSTTQPSYPILLAVPQPAQRPVKGAHGAAAKWLTLDRLVPGLRLFDIKFAWFNEHEYCGMFPRTLLARR